MSVIKKQIKDFDLNPNPQDQDLFLLQTANGSITQNTTKSAFLNETNASLVGLQTQIDNISSISGAQDVYYDNSTSGLDATNVQDAIDEIADELNKTLCVYDEVRGNVECVPDQQIYDVTYNVAISGNVEINPVVSLIIPSSGSTMYVQGIFDVTTTGFKVLLSEAPETTGYKITWNIANVEEKIVVQNFTDLLDTPSSYTGANGQVVTVSGGSLVFAESESGYKGKFPLTIDEKFYTISNSNITTNSVPVCTVVIPLSGETIPTPAIYDVENGSFKVELSISPKITDYYLNWIVL